MSNQITPGRARHIMNAYRPKGWKIIMGERGSEQRGAGGLCDFSNRTIYVPLVCDDYSLCVYLHEVAHQKLHRFAKTPTHVQEYEAEQWAMLSLRAWGFKVTREILRAAKDNVRDCITVDRILELPITGKIERWAALNLR